MKSTDLSKVLADWYSDETNLINLQNLLANPVLQNAIRCVQEIHSPTKNVAVFGQPKSAASTYHYTSGVFDAFRGLEALTKKPQPPVAPKHRELLDERNLSNPDHY